MCVSKTSFRKYKWKVAIFLFNYSSSKSTFFMLNMRFDVLLSIVGILHLLQYKDYKNIVPFALCFDMYFFIKTWLFSILVIIIFNSIMASVSNSHCQQQSRRWRNDNISLDVWEKKTVTETLAKACYITKPS